MELGLQAITVFLKDIIHTTVGIDWFFVKVAIFLLYSAIGGANWHILLFAKINFRLRHHHHLHSSRSTDSMPVLGAFTEPFSSFWTCSYLQVRKCPLYLISVYIRNTLTNFVKIKCRMHAKGWQKHYRLNFYWYQTLTGLPGLKQCLSDRKFRFIMSKQWLYKTRQN